MKIIDDPADWVGKQLTSQTGWRHTLTAVEISGLTDMAAEISAVINGDSNQLLKLPAEAFDLGSFAAKIQDLYTGLKQRSGVVMIHGLPVDTLTPLEIATIYWGIGRHLGNAMPNNPQGDMIGHVTDVGQTQSDANSRGYQTREAMDYHCDQSDIVGLLCMRTAKSGGISKVASSVAMYNTLVREYPEYAEALAATLYWTKHGEFAAGDKPYYTSPVFNFFNGQLCTSFGPKHIIKGHQLPGVPELTTLQRAALTTAEDITDQQRFDIELKVGDMQFLNNYVVLHTRSAYEDYEEPSRKRLLWRLWLMNNDLRPRTGYSQQWQRGVNTGSDNARISI